MGERKEGLLEGGENMVSITLEDDTVLECVVLTIFSVDSQEYIVVMPVDQGEEEDGLVYLYRYEEKDGEPVLTNIESDEEYELAAQALDEILEEQELEDLEDLEDLSAF